METPWRIELLGKLRVRCGDREVALPATRKCCELLAYLVVHKDQLQPRGELAAKLWPALDPLSGRRALTAALGGLRRLSVCDSPNDPAASGRERLPFPLLTSDHGIHVFPGGVATDVHDYLQLLDQAAACSKDADRLDYLLQAQRLHNGPLLPGWTGDWVCFERNILSAMQQRVLLQIIAIHSKLGRADLALEQALRAVALFPTDEKAHERAMELYVRCGRRAEALRQFRELTHVLWLSTGGTPSPAATRLARSIGWVDTPGSQALGAQKGARPLVPVHAG